METGIFLCNACGEQFNKAGTVYCEGAKAFACPECSYTGFERRQSAARVTKEQLRQYIYLKRETELCEKKLSRLKTDSDTARELYELIENNKLRCMALLLKLQSFIYSIDDSVLRQIFEYRYIEGRNWAGVAAAMGGYASADGLRILHDRYLKALEKE